MLLVELLHISIVFLRPSVFHCIKKTILSPQEIRFEDRQTQLRKVLLDDGAKDSSTPKLGALTTDASLFKAAITKATQLDELKETMKLGDDSRRAPAEGDSKEETKVMPKIDSRQIRSVRELGRGQRPEIMIAEVETLGMMVGCRT
ncbi:unnamed protein product, partial [Musa textilis]